MWLSQMWFIPIFSSPILTRERSLYFPHDDNETRVNCHHVIQNITGPATQKAGYVCFNGGSCQLVIYFAGFQLQSQPKRKGTATRPGCNLFSPDSNGVRGITGTTSTATKAGGAPRRWAFHNPLDSSKYLKPEGCHLGRPGGGSWVRGLDLRTGTLFSKGQQPDPTPKGKPWFSKAGIAEVRQKWGL